MVLVKLETLLGHTIDYKFNTGFVITFMLTCWPYEVFGEAESLDFMLYKNENIIGR